MIRPATTDHASTASADSAWTLRDYALIADGERGALNRFRHRDKPLGHAGGGFLLCGFTMALAAHAQGLHPEAARWSERTRSACGPTGLFAEEYDVAQRQLRGNLPQGSVHALLLECSARFSDATEAVPSAGW